MSEQNGSSGAERVTVAAVQTDPKLGQNAHNLRQMVERARAAAERGARLIVFPECALTGYCFQSLEESARFAEPVPGPATVQMAALCRELDVYVIFGLLEREGDQIFNCAALVGPEGLVGKYHKSHLPFEAVDRFAAQGQIGFQVHETAVGRIGMAICFDMRFPETARALALAGADIVANPTNLPPPGRTQPDYMLRTRGNENHVFIISADRAGDEAGVHFIGRSQIVDVDGNVLAEAGAEEETIFAEIEPARARDKNRVFEPGVYEMHLWGQRRPELYGAITERAASVV
jgi:predicted amidohydrolase